jgi:plastocyanin
MSRLLVLLPIGLLLTACGGGGGTSESTSGGAVVQTIQISEKEFSLTPSTVSLSQTGTYEFQVKNDGTVTHALEVENGGDEVKTDDIAPGETLAIRMTFSKDGSFEMYCPIDGHKDQGMKGSIEVGSGAAGGGMTTTDQTTTEKAPGY